MLNSEKHYNEITGLWQSFVGDNFHFGYFDDEDISLDQATQKLTEVMANLARLNAGDSVLDIGCGVGGPAFYISEQFHCNVMGISNSEEGIRIASKKASHS